MNILTKRQIGHDEAQEAMQRLVDSHFDNPNREHARMSIPANPDRDDDLVLSAYIRQQRDLTTGFQKRVQAWLMECFSMEICRDRTERCHRFTEEALELVQAVGMTASEAHQLVDYVWGRPVGDVGQEIGGTMVTLAALCSALDMSMEYRGDVELGRIWENIDKIRAKQAAKPKHSPLPV